MCFRLSCAPPPSSCVRPQHQHDCIRPLAVREVRGLTRQDGWRVSLREEEEALRLVLPTEDTLCEDTAGGGLRRNQPRGHPDLGLLASQTREMEVCCFSPCLRRPVMQPGKTKTLCPISDLGTRLMGETAPTPTHWPHTNQPTPRPTWPRRERPLHPVLGGRAWLSARWERKRRAASNPTSSSHSLSPSRTPGSTLAP